MAQGTKATVKAIRSTTVCEKCGGQPIEWHHDDHPANPERRVSNLVDDCKALAVILAEIERCEALCRRCHMSVDGRGKILGRGGYRNTGEANAKARLSYAQVEAIRQRFATATKPYGLQSAMAREYGVSVATINNVVRGRSWT